MFISENITMECIEVLMQAIVQQCVEDYRKAKELISNCKSRSCSACKKPAGGVCEYEIELIKDFFHGSLFRLTYPNIDGDWLLKTVDEQMREESEKKVKRRYENIVGNTR